MGHFKYIIDTSSLIDLARKNPFDIYPTVWINMENLIDNPIILIVTEEKLRGNRLKIPYVSEKFNLKAINIIEMFRKEGWTF